MENKTIKILAIDDNQDNLITIRALAGEAFPDARILTALNGLSGIEIASKEDPDVILLDIVMPEMDGFEVCRRLKEDKKLSNIPIVFVTAIKDDKSSRIKALEYGAEAFLAKPIDESELIAQIRAMVKIKNANDSREDENIRLAELVKERTLELNKTHTATLNLLEDLKFENEARIKTEKALRESEELYRSVINASPDNITFTDLQGNIIMISPKGLELVGYKNLEEVKNKKLDDFLISGDRERAHRNLEDMFKGIFNGPEEYGIIKADGTVVDTEINAEFVKDSSGNPSGFVFAIRDITERKRAQNDLRESENKYRFITEKISDVVWLLDLEGNSLFVSHSIEKFTGFTVEEYLKQSIHERFTPESAEMALKTLRYEVQRYIHMENKPLDFKRILILEYICKDGGTKFGELLITPYLDENNEFVGVHGVTRDVTERKQAENALRESEEKFRDMANLLPQIVFETDLEGNLTYVNGQASILCGYKDDEMLGQNALKFFKPEDRSRVNNNFRKRFTEKNFGSNDYYMEKKDGTSSPVLIYSNAIVKNDINIGLRGLIVDITEQKKAEKAIRESEALYRAILEASPDNIIISDPNGIIQMTSPFILSKYGFDSDKSLVGTNITDFIIKEDHQKVKNDFALMLQGIKTGPNEYRSLRADGTLLHIEVNGGIIRSSEQQIERLVFIVRDISERKIAEEKLSYVTRLYAFLSQINQVIVRKKDATELLETICELAINFGQFKMCWFGIYDENKKVIVPKSFAGHNDGYLDNLIISPESDSTGNGPTGRAFSQGEMIFTNDISSDPSMMPWKEEALKRGYRSSFAAPLIRKGKLYGTLTLYASEINFFDEEEQKLLSEITEDIAFALDAIDSEEERNMAEEALIKSEAKYREFVENSPEAIAIYSDNIVTYVNKECVRLMRAKSKDDLIGMAVVDFIHPDNRATVIERMQQVAVSEIDISLPLVEEKYIRLDGTPIYVEVKVMPLMMDDKPAVQLTARDITDRKKIEEALEVSRTELKTIYDNAPVMMCLVDRDRKILFANHAFTSMTGVSEEDLKGGTVGGVINCIHSFDDHRGCGYGPVCATCNLRLAMERTFQTGKEHKNIEYHSTLSVGNEEKEVYLLGSTAIIETKGENNLLLCLHDITNRKLAEDALQKNEMFLRTFIENTPFEIWARNENNVGILENRKMLDHYGSILGKTPTDFSENDQRITEIWKNNNKRVFAGEVIDEELQIFTKNGMGIYQQIIFPIYNKDQIIGIAGINIDITDRKKIEKELSDQKRFFEQMFMQSSLSTQILDKDGWCERINPKLTELFGVESQDIEGGKYNIFKDDEIIRNGIDKKLNKVFKKGQTVDWEVYFDIGVAADSEGIAVKEKKKVWFNNWAYPIFEENGELSHVIIQHNDISDRKAAEEALSESQEQIKKFAAHLQNVREEERILLAREIHDELGQILIAIKIDMGILKQNVLKRSNIPDKENFQSSFDNLFGLVDNTIKTARKIMTDLRPEVLDVLGFVDAVKQYTSKFQERHKITCIFDSKIQNLNFNSQQSVALFRIIQESLTNVAKHAKATLVNITLGIDDSMLSLIIADNGVGFDENHKKNVDSYGLIGMNERVLILDGRLTISSAVGKGTTIKIIMPYSGH